MTGFGRALRGEIYALAHRRGVRLALLLVVAGVVLRVLAAWLELRLLGSGAAAEETATAAQAAHANFWPRWAEGARFGLILAEVFTLVIVGSALPREIASGAARDPLTRRISRPAFLAARAVAALLLPLVLAAAAVGASAWAAAACFDAGPITSPPFLYEGDPAAEAAFRQWLAATGASADDVAAWRKLVDGGADPLEASHSIGLPAVPPAEALETWPIPFLYRWEDDIRREVLRGLLQGLPSLLALGLFALLLGATLPSAVLASGAAVGLVLLFGVFLAPELGDGASWIFADGLPGMGHGSELVKARLFADGYSDVVATAPAALRAQVLGSAGGAALFFALAQLAFRRRRL